MTRPHEDDRDAIDRAFAEMVAGYHLTAERPDPSPPEHVQPVIPGTADRVDQPTGPRAEEPRPDPAAGYPLFDFTPEPEPVESPVEDEPVEPYVPEPLPPLRRPGAPALLGWIGIGYSVLVVLAATFGLRVPTWAVWLAVGSFVAGFAVLVTQLPRERPPDAGNGAVV